MGAANRVVTGLVFFLEHLSGHAGEGGGGSNLDETLEVVESEEEALSLNHSAIQNIYSVKVNI